MNVSNFCVFHPILTEFGMGANVGLKIKYGYFLTNQTKSKLTNSEIFQLHVLRQTWMKFCIGAMIGPALELFLPAPSVLLTQPWRAPGPTLLLLLPCSCPALGLLLPFSCPDLTLILPCFCSASAHKILHGG